ncbi:hypothetical protein RhiirB3_442101 [Rhizophagus irregularis]|nr:hypothetical protein RhiirB3_442101 [Rhizophagus irregularis]
MSYKTSKSNILMGDGGIDLIGEHRGVKFIVQCNNFTRDKVIASLVINFIDYQIIPPDTLGIFVTTIGYTENSVYDILLVNISDLIKQYADRKIKKHSSDNSDIIIIDEMLNLKDYWLLGLVIGLSALVLRIESVSFKCQFAFNSNS